ncbi:hypothetical protein V6Z12_D08G091700 [Gossypium hirsutum]
MQRTVKISVVCSARDRFEYGKIDNSIFSIIPGLWRLNYYEQC